MIGRKNCIFKKWLYFGKKNYFWLNKWLFIFLAKKVIYF